MVVVMAPGATAEEIDAVVNTVRCTERSPGCPNVWPNGNSTPTMRGVSSCSAVAGIIVTVTVGIPAASMRRANTGTLRQQSGQTGASTTPSAPSSRNCAAIAGAVSRRHTSSPACW